MLSLRGAGKSFGALEVLHDVNLDIPTGKTTVIIGESGSGKSVLLKLMNGLVVADKGQVLLFGEDLARCSGRKLDVLRKRTGMVLQNYALIDSITVLDNVAFPLRENSRLREREIRSRVLHTLGLLGIADAATRLPSELSGGMKKRVSFARAVIHEPELVLFDEPTTGLDPVMIDFVDNLIAETQRLFEITSVIISHDMASVMRLADRVAMLHGGTLCFQGDVAALQACPLEAVQRFISVGGSGRLADAGVTQAVAAVSSQAKGDNAVEVRGLHKRFGDNHVLRGIDLDIPRKEITVIIGGSGSGKSVLLKHILGLFRPDAGSVKVDGAELTAMSEGQLEELRTHIGMLFQGAALFDSMTVWENLAFPLVERGRRPSRSEVNRRISEILERLHLSEIAQANPADISAGQRKRVGLARAIITKPEIMIYDEPTTGQDPVMIRYVDDMIVEAHAAFKLTSIVISHDMQSTFRIADKVAMVYEGRMAAVGTPAELMASTVPEVRKFIGCA